MSQLSQPASQFYALAFCEELYQMLSGSLGKCNIPNLISLLVYHCNLVIELYQGSKTQLFPPLNPYCVSVTKFITIRYSINHGMHVSNMQEAQTYQSVCLGFPPVSFLKISITFDI